MKHYTFINYESDSKLRVLILAGVHGDEIGTIYLAYNLIRYLDEGEFPFKHISKLTIIPVVNYSGLRECTRYTNNNYQDLNREWSVCRDTRSELSEFIDESDVIIDLHCSDNCDTMLLIDREMNNARALKSFCKLINFHYTILSGNNSTLKRYINDDKGKVGITWEQRGLVTCDHLDNVKNTENLIHLLSKIHLIENYLLDHEEIQDTEVAQLVTNRIEGIYEPVCDLGSTLEDGDLIGRIKDLDTDQVIERIVAHPSSDRYNVRIMLQPKGITYVKAYQLVIYAQDVPLV